VTRYVAALLLCFALAPAAFGRGAFEEFQSCNSPVLARQAALLARWAVTCRLKGQEFGKLPVKINPLLRQSAGVFVTITKDGRPRRCMGSVYPRGSVLEGILEGARGAALQDLRRPPLTLAELGRVQFHVSVVCPLRPVRGMQELAPNYLGLLVRSGDRAGVLLPGEAKTARWQVAECRRKAGIEPGAPASMYVFRTVLLSEHL
jgi:AMMECR1 domain-containing protein